jgi:hypothetical protein
MGARRRVLYLSPFLVPNPRVGALRPYKFLRHLDAQGWDVTVFTRSVQGNLPTPALPPNITLRYGWPARGDGDQRVVDVEESHQAQPFAQSRPSLRVRLARRLPDLRPAGLGEALRRGLGVRPRHRNAQAVQEAIGRGRQLLSEASFDAVLVCAPPFEACTVGAALAREAGLPLVLDLRDPWARCDIPGKSGWTGPAAEAAEREAMAAASHVLLNTEQACAAYRSRYPERPAETFSVLRNAVDPELFDRPCAPWPAGPFTALFAGRVRNPVNGLPLLRAIHTLRDEGIGPQRLRMVVSRLDAKASRTFVRQKLSDQVWVGPDFAYGQVGAVMEAADLLVLMHHDSHLRIPSKTYDYLASRRPILAITDNPELVALLNEAGGARTCSPTAPDEIAAALRSEIELGPGRSVEHDWRPHSAVAATERLATVLNEAVQQHR